VTALLDEQQRVSGQYLYDPFGNTLKASGPHAGWNRYRFSSKPAHEASGMYDYLYRWYAPELQRWVNRDQVADSDSLFIASVAIQEFLPFELYNRDAIYVFVANAPVLYVDPNGEWILPASIIAVTIAYIIWHDIHNIQHPPPIYAPEPPERPEPPALMAPNPNCRSFPIPRRSPNDPLNYSDPNDPNLRYNRPPRPMPPSRWRAATEFESHDPDLNVIEATNA
jgi:RHS repeat-associated protein